MRFLCEPETGRNGNGEIAWVKVRWSEAREITEWAIEGTGDNLAYFGLGVFGFSLLPAVAFQMPGFVVAGAAIMVVALSLACWLWWRLPRMRGRERALVFLRNGKLRAPLSLSAGAFPGGESRLPHLGIKSIEARPLVLTGEAAKTRYTHGVVAFYASGQMNQLAEQLMPDQAHLLAVVLMAGLNELRDDLAVAPGQRARPAGAARADDVID